MGHLNLAVDHKDLCINTPFQQDLEFTCMAMQEGVDCFVRQTASFRNEANHVARTK